MIKHRALAVVAMALAYAAWGAAQQPASAPQAASDDGVVVSGSGLATRTFHVADLAAFKRQTVHAEEHGTPAEFSGFAVVDLLRACGAPLGESLRGRKLAQYLVVDAADGYRVVYSLGELDPDLSKRTVWLVDQRDGKPLSAAEGPWRLVAPDEGRPARWVRQVRSLTLRAVE